MINFKLLKNTLLSFLILSASLISILLFFSISDKPIIKEMTSLNLKELQNKSSSIQVNDYLVEENNQQEFNYKLVGIRYGEQDSSVIVKKGNKESLVIMGDYLDSTFELIEVNQSDAVFRNGQKMYRINKHEDK